MCAGQKVVLSNCLATTHPEIAKEWHPTKNGDLTPYDVVPGTLKKVWWICEKCEHEWERNVSGRTRGAGCPKCGTKKGGENLVKNKFVCDCKIIISCGRKSVIPSIALKKRLGKNI